MKIPDVCPLNHHTSCTGRSCHLFVKDWRTGDAECMLGYGLREKDGRAEPSDVPQTNDWRQRIREALSESKINGPESLRDERVAAYDRIESLKAQGALPADAAFSDAPIATDSDRPVDQASPLFEQELSRRLEEETARLRAESDLFLENEKKRLAEEASADLKKAEDDIRRKCAAQYLAERNAAAEEDRRLRLEYDDRLSRETAALDERRKLLDDREKQIAAAEKRLAEREMSLDGRERLLNERSAAAAKIRLAENRQKYDQWLSARASRLESEDAALLSRVAEKSRAAANSEKYDQWLSARASRLESEDAALLSRVSEKSRAAANREKYESWLSARASRLESEDAALLSRVAEKSRAAAESLPDESGALFDEDAEMIRILRAEREKLVRARKETESKKNGKNIDEAVGYKDKLDDAFKV